MKKIIILKFIQLFTESSLQIQKEKLTELEKKLTGTKHLFTRRRKKNKFFKRCFKFKRSKPS